MVIFWTNSKFKGKLDNIILHNIEVVEEDEEMADKVRELEQQYDNELLDESN